MTTFKQRMQQKFAAQAPVKPTKVKTLPYLTEPVKAMRSHLGEFYKKYPKTALVFSPQNRAYNIARKYLYAEDLLQIAFTSYLRQYEPETFYLHVDNERRAKIGNVQKAKVLLMSVQKGTADLLLRREGLPPFWLELKAGKAKRNTVSKDQKAFLERQRSFGDFTGIAVDLWECLELMDQWKKCK